MLLPAAASCSQDVPASPLLATCWQGVPTLPPLLCRCRRLDPACRQMPLLRPDPQPRPRACAPPAPAGEIGSWKDRFTVAQSEAFDRLYKQRMAGSGLEFDFE